MYMEQNSEVKKLCKVRPSLSSGPSSLQSLCRFELTLPEKIRDKAKEVKIELFIIVKAGQAECHSKKKPS